MKRLLICFFLIISIFGYAVAQDATKPNVVFIFIDDMGYADLGCFGNPVMKTPNIDRLAEEGIRLTNFYVNSPICSASRVSITTGQYQQRWRIHSYLSSREQIEGKKMAPFLSLDAPTDARLFKSAGYATAHFGKWHMGGGRDIVEAPLPTEYGFDETYVSFEGLGDRVLFGNGRLSKFSEDLGRGKIDHAPKDMTTEIYVNKTIDFIKRNKDKPFYVRMFPNDVHDAHLPKEGAAFPYSKITDNPAEQKFFAVLEEMDRNIGRLVNAVDELGLGENTIILLTSDNGPTDWPRYYEQGITPPGFTGPFFGRKWSLFEGGIRMPFICRWTGKIPAATTNETTVMAGIDILPTLASLAGISLPKSYKPDGKDMSKALMGEAVEREGNLYWEYGTLGSILPGKKEHISPFLAMRRGDFKVLVNPDGSELKLFNLVEDPGESNNLAQKNAKRAQALKKQLIAWWDEIKQVYDSY